MAVFSDIWCENPEIISKGLFPILILEAVADQEEMKRYYGKNPEHPFNNLKLTENQILVECNSYGTDILTGTQFDILFSHSDVKNFKSEFAVLEYASYNRSYEVDVVPNGYSPLAIINFPEGKPEMLNKLRQEREKLDPNRYEKLYLTQKSVMEKILNEFEKIKK